MTKLTNPPTLTVTPAQVAQALAELAADCMLDFPEDAARLAGRLGDVLAIPPDDPAFQQAWPLLVRHDDPRRLRLPNLQFASSYALNSYPFDLWWANLQVELHADFNEPDIDAVGWVLEAEGAPPSHLDWVVEQARPWWRVWAEEAAKVSDAYQRDAEDGTEYAEPLDRQENRFVLSLWGPGRTSRGNA
jgi:hypothetical protein